MLLPQSPLSLHLARAEPVEARLAQLRLLPRLHHHPIHPHRLGNVLDRLLTQILVVQRQLVLDLVIDRARDADTAGNSPDFPAARRC